MRSAQCAEVHEVRHSPRVRQYPSRVPEASGSSRHHVAIHILLQRIPRTWRQAKVITLQKPGKEPHVAANYRPISLLSVCYKLLERIVLQRINPVVEDLLSVDQSGFRRGRCTSDQVTALTTFIENGFQKNLKTGTVFSDLTAAYDTIWHIGLLVKLSKCLPFWCVRTVELLLRNRRFRVHMGDDTSSWRTHKNGLPQGSVLAPTLFNLYTNDLPTLLVRKFIYADDICCATKAETFAELECTLTADLARLTQYCQQWRLKPSVSKTVASVFHLRNTSANRQLNAQQLTEAPHSVHTLFSVCSLRDDNVITSKNCCKLKHANSILESSEDFWQISSKSIHIISSYAVSKLGRF